MLLKFGFTVWPGFCYNFGFSLSNRFPDLL